MSNNVNNDRLRPHRPSLAMAERVELKYNTPKGQGKGKECSRNERTEKLAPPTPTMTTLRGKLEAATRESIVWKGGHGDQANERDGDQAIVRSSGCGGRPTGAEQSRVEQSRIYTIETSERTP